jgi:hypothetical protein
MSDIFISYAREDRDKAKALAELFQQQDWSVWWDRNIPPGRSFDEVIEQALGAAKCVVVLWSKNSASSDWVKGEAAEGLRRKILVPVCIDSANVPLEFRRLETVDLSDWKGEAGHPELGGFLEAVAANIKGVAQRPPSEGSQRKLMKPVLTVLAIVALLAAGFAFYKFAGDRARLGSRASAGGSPRAATSANAHTDTRRRQVQPDSHPAIIPHNTDGTSRRSQHVSLLVRDISRAASKTVGG